MFQYRPNRLSSSTSPYLLQHANNPVDWYPWGDEALQRARTEDKPIFLSIGYSACHWCHVMERESFENIAVADVLNRYFVSIKVDREERPDLDDIYMGAVQALTGRGGWPMSVWLTPDLEPFYGGTYFPLEPRLGFPGFLALLERIAAAWGERREEVVRDAERLRAALERQASHVVGEALGGQGLAGEAVFDRALDELRASFDAAWGGFGSAPKFPPVSALSLILERGRAGDRVMVDRTLDAMADGGFFDHLGGGFARYSVDAQWRVPHFEKMLYDNAQLASLYARAFLGGGRERDAQVVRRTLDYLLRDMRDEAGGFHSSEDADSEGEEGRFYVFTPDEVASILGPSDGARFCRAYGIGGEGDLESGGSVLHWTGTEPDRAGFEPLLARMHEARNARVRPQKDDKVLASWNGLALSALAHGYQALAEARYLDAALACGTFLHERMRVDGALARVWRRGTAHTSGFLEDYASVAAGFLDLGEATGESCWLERAEHLLIALRDRFEDPQGGFFATEQGRSDVLLRLKPAWDHSLPSANAMAVQALLHAGCHLDRKDFVDSAERALAHFSAIQQRAPQGCLGLLLGLDGALRGSMEITIAGASDDPRTQALQEEAWRCPTMRRVIRRHPVPEGGVPVAIVCSDRTCSQPVTDPKALRRLLSGHI